MNDGVGRLQEFLGRGRTGGFWLNQVDTSGLSDQPPQICDNNTVLRFCLLHWEHKIHPLLKDYPAVQCKSSAPMKYHQARPQWYWQTWHVHKDIKPN